MYLVNSISNLQSKYRELIPNGQNQEFIIETINQALAENTALNKSCKVCAREGRANMAAGIFLGAATGGSTLGFYGAWVGAVVGFWAAGEQTVTCLKAAGC